MSGWNDQLQLDYEALLARADLVTISSTGFRDQLPKEVSQRAKLLLNAADAHAFMAGLRQACPKDLAVVRRPRIGYVGVLSKKIDFKLIASIARREQAWQWVLVGPIKGLEGESRHQPGIPDHFLAQCLSLPNVHFLGFKAATELPAYTAHMDVNVMPYITRRSAGLWARNAYPLKFHEYLAVGRPIVSAHMPALREYQDVLAMVEDDEDAWCRALRHAIYEGGVGTHERRQTLAMANTWDQRAVDLDTWLHDMVSR